MIRLLNKGLLACFCAVASTVLLLAVTPKFWELFTQEELLKGKLRGVSISNDGKLLLAPQYDAIYTTEQGLIFAMTADASSNIYLGSGHEGRVFKVDAKGKGEPFFKTEEIDVFALACDSLGNLYVGSSPDGKVYKVGPNGKGTAFFDPKDKYIWDLLFDKEGNLYVATGGKGLLYRVDKAGVGTVLYDSEEAHLISLAFDLEGNIIAGSAPNGHVYRISKQGKAFIVFDSPMAEVRRVAVDRIGNIYALALAAASTSLSRPPKETGSGSATSLIRSLTSGAEGASPGAPGSTAGAEDQPTVAPGVSSVVSSLLDRTSAKSLLYRIGKEGSIEKLWSSNTDMAFDFLVRDDGRILMGTGNKGRILAIDSQFSYTIMTESGEEQVTRLLILGSDLYAATSNTGKLYRMQPVRSRNGEYESEVFDAGMPCAWGSIAWKATAGTGTTLELYTRSGNTPTQNKTWNDWAGPYLKKEGEAIKSPPARYLQWKVVFKSAGTDRKLISAEDMLEGLSVAYLQQNVRPQVTSITVLAPGVALQKVPAIPSSGGVISIGGMSDIGSPTASSPLNQRKITRTPSRRTFKAGAQSFTWKATDENDDELLFDIYFKGENEAEWKLLERELEDDYYTIDSNDLPDGVYTVKVVASDAPSNPVNLALAGEIVSKPFVISNSAPSLDIIKSENKGRRVEVTYRARSAATRLYSAEFSIDGGAWSLLFPKDGITDSKEEEFVLLTQEMTSGEHLLGLRVTDTAGNVGAQKVVVKIP